MNQDENEVIESEIVAEKLIEVIKADTKIGSTTSLNDRAIEDNLPAMCRTIVGAISRNNPHLLTACKTNWGSQHGFSRSAQDFKPKELVREFFLLKQIVVEELAPQLTASSPLQIIEQLASIDFVINKVMENSFESYAKLRKQQVEDLNRQILLTNQEITRLIANRQDNISYLMHEIKNPLTSIVGYSDLFLRYQQKQNNTVDNLQHIHQVLQQGRNIIRLINDTNEISAYQKGDFKLRLEKVEICLLLEDVVLSLRPAIEAKKLKLITSCCPTKLIIESDYLRIQQIINNLLSNAIRYTIEGQIELTCCQTSNNSLEIRVSDTGIGICLADRDRIFEPFFRAQNSQERAPEGVGLGLAIVSQLVALLKGKIEFDSDVDVGSTFVVTIPLIDAKSLN